MPSAKKVKMSPISFPGSVLIVLPEGNGSVYVQDVPDEVIYGYDGNRTIVIYKESNEVIVNPPATAMTNVWATAAGSYPATFPYSNPNRATSLSSSAVTSIQIDPTHTHDGYDYTLPGTVDSVVNLFNYSETGGISSLGQIGIPGYGFGYFVEENSVSISLVEAPTKSYNVVKVNQDALNETLFTITPSEVMGTIVEVATPVISIYKNKMTVLYSAALATDAAGIIHIHDLSSETPEMPIKVFTVDLNSPYITNVIENEDLTLFLGYDPIISAVPFLSLPSKENTLDADIRTGLKYLYSDVASSFGTKLFTDVKAHIMPKGDGLLISSNMDTYQNGELSSMFGTHLQFETIGNNYQQVQYIGRDVSWNGWQVVSEDMIYIFTTSGRVNLYDIFKDSESGNYTISVKYTESLVQQIIMETYRQPYINAFNTLCVIGTRDGFILHREDGSVVVYKGTEIIREFTYLEILTTGTLGYNMENGFYQMQRVESSGQIRLEFVTNYYPST